jgi:hypothetical protein
MRQRGERKELLAAISLSTMRAALTFAGVRFKKTQAEQIEGAGLDRCAGRMFQWALGEVDAQEEQPVIAWICVAQRESGVQAPRTEKALRDELDRRKVATPLWMQVQQHVERMWGK